MTSRFGFRVLEEFNVEVVEVVVGEYLDLLIVGECGHVAIVPECSGELEKVISLYLSEVVEPVRG